MFAMKHLHFHEGEIGFNPLNVKKRENKYVEREEIKENRGMRWIKENEKTGERKEAAE